MMHQSAYSMHIAVTLPIITLLLLLLRRFLHLTGWVYKIKLGHDLPYVRNKDGVTV